MNEKSFQVDILSPQNLLYSGVATSVAVPGELGSFGIWADHAPIISKLIPGMITLKEASGEILRFKSQAKGFLEVFKNQVTVLVDQAEKVPL